MQYHEIPCIINNCWRSVPLPCGQYKAIFDIEQLCIGENRSALERDRSMWEGGHFLISSCDGLVLVAPLPAHLLMKPFCRWNFPTFKFISYQTFKHANQRTCKLKKLSNYSVFDLNVPTFSLYRPTHILQRFRSSEFLQAGALICNLLPFLDKICSCDLISLGQEISMLFVFQHLLPAR